MISFVLTWWIIMSLRTRFPFEKRQIYPHWHVCLHFACSSDSYDTRLGEFLMHNAVDGRTSTSWWRNLPTEPAVFVPRVAKQYDVFPGAFAFEVLVSARASFWLDRKIRKLLFPDCKQSSPRAIISRQKTAGKDELWKISLKFASTISVDR